MAQTKENKEKTHLTLAPEIKKAGLKYAEELGMSFSAFVSMRIADYKGKGKK
jgi:hypothetical protein